MSKIIIDEIEAKTTDVKLAPNGTGVVEVTGDTIDGTVQLNSSTQLNNVKIKPPADSAGQNHTIILPDNDVDVDKYLKVKSVTGSGATAVGQLEYATVANIDTTNLNANDFTTGNLPSARMPSPLPNTSGFAQKLISKTTLTSNVSTIELSGFDVDSQFTLVAKNLSTTSTDIIEMAWLTNNPSSPLQNGGNATSEIHAELPRSNATYYIKGGTGGGSAAFNYPNNTAHFKLYGSTSQNHGFIADFNTEEYMTAMMYRNWTGYYQEYGMCEAWLSINAISTYTRIYGIRLKTHYGYQFTAPTELLLYKLID